MVEQLENLWPWSLQNMLKIDSFAGLGWVVARALVDDREETMQIIFSSNKIFWTARSKDGKGCDVTE